MTDDNKDNDNYAAVVDNYDSYDDNDELMRGIKIVAYWLMLYLF